MELLRSFLLLCTFMGFLIVSVYNEEIVEQKCELPYTSGRTDFPEKFKFGVATAAYQIEGGWNEDGKGPSIWDTFTHEHPDLIEDQSTGDVAADSYHRFEQDLAALKELKVNFYRFSISWPRILPNGDVSSTNTKGIEYYNMVIDKLIENNIEPMVTMFHYDMPEELAKFGGMTNSLFYDYFLKYAETLFENFGDRVKMWITFNEPFNYCVPGYGYSTFPPLVYAPGIGDYLCMENTLKAHAGTYRMYKAKYFHRQRGKVGITISSGFTFSETGRTELVQRSMEFGLGWLATPLFNKTGNYPDSMIRDIRENSIEEGRGWSRLRPLSHYWSHLVKGAGDFLGINYYTSSYVEERTNFEGVVPSFDHDISLNFRIDPNWKQAISSWLYCVPEGLEELLKWIRDNYNNIEVYVTENGWSDEGQLDDTDRISYLKAHLQAVLNAVNSGCNVAGYTYWSLIDNFEWRRGYTEKFGLYYVNMTSDGKERIPKDSARYYQNVIANRMIPES